MFLGVGTAMSVQDYDGLAADIVADKPIITIVSDHAPRFFVKLSSRSFRKYYNAMTKSLEHLVPVCKGKKPLILVGAHSASGQASIKALPDLVPQPDGYVGLDPFSINEKMTISPSIPTLEWGFAKTTCAVKIDQAAKAAYEISSKDHRVFYRIDNVSKEIAHCVFTDKGCAFICGKKEDGEWVRGAVAQSIHKFVQSIKSGLFYRKAEFSLPGVDSSLFSLFVNTDEV